MLLMFFMVSTTFKQSQGLKLILPDAKKIEKLKVVRDVATIWVDRSGNISLDDRLIEVKQIRNLVYNKVVDPLHPMKLVALRVDMNSEMGIVSDIHEELRAVGGAALQINYSTRTATD
ncbi:MAG: biopolymer transporter ExbD [Calditrichaeota bacterium]|nr:MAG: biopolymer transporter ExbD [Calditrichota bacterium]